MITLVNIKQYCTAWKASLKARISSRTAKLTIIQVGNVEASNRYIRNKIKDCEEVGISAKHIKVPDTIGTNDLVSLLFDEQYDCDGIIVQLPLPEHIDLECVKKAIDPDKDVDGFRIDSIFDSCTPLGIMTYLRDGCSWDPEGKNVCVIGRSEIVGKPMAQMMTDAGATVTLCHSKTHNIYNHVFNADLIICAVGKEKFLNCYPIHKPVIDVGINFNEEGKLVGDCYNTENRDVTPVPGGVGLLTRCALLENVVKAYEKNISFS